MSEQGIPGLTEEQRAKIDAKLKAYAEAHPTPTEGETTKQADNKGEVSTGADVDWSEYDLEYNLRHLYPKATIRETQQGLKWVVMVDEFYSASKSGTKYGQKVNRPGAVDKTDTEPLNLSEYLNDVINGPEGWKIAALLPGMAGDAIVLLQRKVPVVLPDPKLLRSETEVTPPTDEELARAEAAALEFAETEGFTPATETLKLEEVGDHGLKVADPREVEVETATGAIVARPGPLERDALEINAPNTIPMPVARPVDGVAIKAAIEDWLEGRTDVQQ